MPDVRELVKRNDLILIYILLVCIGGLILQLIDLLVD